MTPTAVPYRTRKTTKRIILHDTHTPPSITTTVAWLRVRGRTMGLLDVGYHYVIERSGRITTCRPVELMGSHTPGCNHDSIGIALAGGREEDWETPSDNFTEEQKVSLKDLLWAIRSDYGPLPLIGHTELQRYRHRDVPCPALDIHQLRKDLS